jgi:hypothetical protein
MARLGGGRNNKFADAEAEELRPVRRPTESTVTGAVSTARSESLHRLQRQSQNQRILIRWSVFPCFTKPGDQLELSGELVPLGLDWFTGIEGPENDTKHEQHKPPKPTRHPATGHKADVDARST